jgi:hypothetical protein
MERLAVRRCPGVELRMTYIDHGNIDGLFMAVSATTAWWFQIFVFSNPSYDAPDSYRMEFSTGTKPRERNWTVYLKGAP